MCTLLWPFPSHHLIADRDRNKQQTKKSQNSAKSWKIKGLPWKTQGLHKVVPSIFCFSTYPNYMFSPLYFFPLKITTPVHLPIFTGLSSAAPLETLFKMLSCLYPLTAIVVCGFASGLGAKPRTMRAFMGLGAGPPSAQRIRVTHNSKRGTFFVVWFLGWMGFCLLGWRWVCLSGVV